MKYSIIEDCSPYYIRFTHDGIVDVIEKSRRIFNTAEFIPNKSWNKNFLHCRLPRREGAKFLEELPLSKKMPLMSSRVSFFVSKPGLYYRAHKDGLAHRFSLNYTIEVLDNKCITNWYSDEDLQHYEIDNLKSLTSRECVDFNKSLHIPIKSMTAKQGECILFNTDIFHDWDNTLSPNRRVVLTLRHEDADNVYFDDAKRILFDNDTLL